MSGQTQTAWLAVDWGTTHLRLWAMDSADRPLAQRSSDRGMGSLTRDGFEPALLDLAEEFLRTGWRMPVVVCGMAGSRQGWAEAAYRATPCPPPGIAEATAVATQDPRLSVHILPGVKQVSPADVMRGEETQIAGFLRQNPNFDGVICLPGTHTKWAHISAGEIVSFRTFMTGEIFGLLADRSVLRHCVSTDDWDAEAFAGAVADTMSRPEVLAAELFGVRARSLIADELAGASRARLSGLLLGAELAAARPYWLGQNIAILGAEALSRIYAQALADQGCAPELADADTTTLQGLTAAYHGLTEPSL